MIRAFFVLVCLFAPLAAIASPSFSGLGMVVEDLPPEGIPEPHNGGWADWTPDGQYAVGYQQTLYSEPTPGGSIGEWNAIRWSASGGIEVLMPSQQQTFGRGISDDGRVIAVKDELYTRALRWEEGVGLTVIPRPHSNGPGSGEGPWGYSTSVGVSGDGSAIFGNTYEVELDPDANPGGCSSCDRAAMVWYDTGEVIVLGDLPGGLYGSEAYGASFDGSVVFGSGRSERGREPFVWDAERGMRAVFDVLSDAGLDTAGWDLGKIVAVSNDGLTIQGDGFNPSGQPESWIAVIPEPSTALLVGLGLIAIGARRWPGAFRSEDDARWR